MLGHSSALIPVGHTSAFLSLDPYRSWLVCQVLGLDPCRSCHVLGLDPCRSCQECQVFGLDSYRQCQVLGLDQCMSCQVFDIDPCKSLNLFQRQSFCGSQHRGDFIISTTVHSSLATPLSSLTPSQEISG